MFDKAGESNPYRPLTDNQSDQNPVIQPIESEHLEKKTKEIANNVLSQNNIQDISLGKDEFDVSHSDQNFDSISTKINQVGLNVLSEDDELVFDFLDNLPEATKFDLADFDTFDKAELAIQSVEEDLSEVRSEIEKNVSEIKHVIEVDGRKIALLGRVDPGKSKPFQELTDQCKNQYKESTDPNKIHIPKKDLAEAVKQFGIVKDKHTFAFSREALAYYGNPLEAMLIEDLSSEWQADFSKIDLNNLPPGLAIQKLNTMSHKEQQQVLKLAKNYLMLATKLFILQNLLIQFKKKARQEQATFKPKAISEQIVSSPGILGTHVPKKEQKATNQIKESLASQFGDIQDAMVRKLERTSAEQTEANRLENRQQSIKKKDENYRQKQERIAAENITLSEKAFFSKTYDKNQLDVAIKDLKAFLKDKNQLDDTLKLEILIKAAKKSMEKELVRGVNLVEVLISTQKFIAQMSESERRFYKIDPDQLNKLIHLLTELGLVS